MSHKWDMRWYVIYVKLKMELKKLLVVWLDYNCPIYVLKGTLGIFINSIICPTEDSNYMHVQLYSLDFV